MLRPETFEEAFANIRFVTHAVCLDLEHDAEQSFERSDKVVEGDMHSSQATIFRGDNQPSCLEELAGFKTVPLHLRKNDVHKALSFQHRARALCSPRLGANGDSAWRKLPATNYNALGSSYALRFGGRTDRV